VAGVVLDMDRRTISHGGKSTYLTTIDARLAWTMLSSPGVLLGRDDLYRRAWGYDDASTMGRCVDVHVAQIRRALVNIDAPMQIAGVRAGGYRLDVTTIGEEGGGRVIDLTFAADRRYDPDPEKDDGQRVATLPAAHQRLDL